MQIMTWIHIFIIDVGRDIEFKHTVLQRIFVLYCENIRNRLHICTDRIIQKLSIFLMYFI